MEDLGSYLRQHPFLQGMKDEHIQKLVDCANNASFEAGEYLFREGQDAKQFFFIRHGRIALELNTHNRGQLTIQTAGIGEILGWSWLLPPYHWHYSAKAVELTRTVALNAECFRERCEEDYELGYMIMKRFAHEMESHLRATRLQLLDIYGKSS